MQADYDARFTREMGCTEVELRAWIPGASRTLQEGDVLAIWPPIAGG